MIIFLLLEDYYINMNFIPNLNKIVEELNNDVIYSLLFVIRYYDEDGYPVSVTVSKKLFIHKDINIDILNLCL